VPVGTPVAASAQRALHAYGVTAGSLVINNNSLVGRAINPVRTREYRVGPVQINEDWNALITQSYPGFESFAEVF